MTPAGASSTKQDAPAVCLAVLAGSGVGREGIDSGIAIRNINMDTCNINMDTCNSEHGHQQQREFKSGITQCKVENNEFKIGNIQFNVGNTLYYPNSIFLSFF